MIPSVTNFGKEPGRPSHSNAAIASTRSGEPDFAVKVSVQNLFPMLSLLYNFQD
jgi:hypothetical protein